MRINSVKLPDPVSIIDGVYCGDHRDTIRHYSDWTMLQKAEPMCSHVGSTEEEAA